MFSVKMLFRRIPSLGGLSGAYPSLTLIGINKKGPRWILHLLLGQSARSLEEVKFRLLKRRSILTLQAFWDQVGSQEL